MRWEVRIVGDPMPTVTWLRNGVAVPNCPDVQLLDVSPLFFEFLEIVNWRFENCPDHYGATTIYDIILQRPTLCQSVNPGEAKVPITFSESDTYTIFHRRRLPGWLPCTIGKGRVGQAIAAA